MALCRSFLRASNVVAEKTTKYQIPALSRRAFSSPTPTNTADLVKNGPILVRDFIHGALYNPEFGYFNSSPGAVGYLERSIPFTKFEGRNAYTKHLDHLYKHHDVSWFTPVELFKPWYGHSIAEAILRTANLSTPLVIYEVGGGAGTCAKCILDYMMLNAPPKVYNNMTYISVEISPELAKRQVETVGDVSSHLARYRVECRDAINRSGWGNVNEQPCWVIMLEVLDNLPHDLIYRENQVSPWMEVLVTSEADKMTLSETHRPLKDPLIQKCIEILQLNTTDMGLRAGFRKLLSKVRPRSRKAWIPTGCLQLFEVLNEVLPKMSLIASDFSYLPDVRIAGEGAPLVSSKKGGQSMDYPSYLDAKGDADIFFPTDFMNLERIDHYCAVTGSQLMDKNTLRPIKKRRTNILETAAFMEAFGLPTKTRTKSGYNPLLEDFRNTKFYLSVPTYNNVAVTYGKKIKVRINLIAQSDCFCSVCID